MTSFAIRIYTYNTTPNFPFVENKVYLEAISDHTWEYITANPVAPPLNHIINLICVKIFGLKNLPENKGYVLVNMLLGILSAIVLFYIGYTVTKNQLISLVNASVFSFALIPFEMWRPQSPTNHYDNYSIFFSCLFCLGIYWFFEKTFLLKKHILVCLIFFISTFQASITIYLVSICLMAQICKTLNNLLKNKNIDTTNEYIKLFSIALVFFSSLCIQKYKNFSYSGIASTSGKAGPAMIMFVQQAFNYDLNRLENYVNGMNLPNWYKSAFSEAKNFPYPGGGQAWIYLAQAFGICMEWQPSARQIPWPFKFDSLIQKLDYDAEIILSIKKDYNDSFKRPFIFSGFSPELSPRWILIYGGQSEKVFYSFIQDYPLLWLKTAYKNLTEKYFCQNSFFLARLSSENALGGQYINPWFFNYEKYFYFHYLQISFLSFLLVIFYYISAMFKKRLNKKNTNENILFFSVVLFIIICFHAFVYTGFVAVENDRYLLQNLPFINLGFPIFLAILSDFCTKKN